jgi:NAD+ synthase (glutamine-hydrolysing)
MQGPADVKLAVKNLIEGIQKHVKENGFERVVVGVSGGIDSALVTTLAQMALGPHNVHCLIMPSPYSSAQSTDFGVKLANNLDCAHTVVPIGNILEAYKMVLALGTITETVTEENLQARIRGNILMAYANHMNALVLATGNKSEAMVGYCTLYGDTVGSLAPIGDIYKTEVYEIARHINREKEIIPKGIIAREPSAELSPGQKDTDVLPPYEILDVILDGYLANLKLGEIAKKAKCSIDVVASVFDRMKDNQFKAAQCAPALQFYWR